MKVKPLFTELEAKALIALLRITMSDVHMWGQIRNTELDGECPPEVDQTTMRRAFRKLDKARRKFNAEVAVKTYLMEAEYEVPAEERTIGDDEYKEAAKLVPMKVKAIKKQLDAGDHGHLE